MCGRDRYELCVSFFRYKRRLVCNPCEKQKLKESKKMEMKSKRRSGLGNMKRSISVDTGLSTYSLGGMKRNQSYIDPELLNCVAKELEIYESPKKKLNSIKTFKRSDSNSYTFGPDSDLDTLYEEVPPPMEQQQQQQQLNQLQGGGGGVGLGKNSENNQSGLDLLASLISQTSMSSNSNSTNTTPTASTAMDHSQQIQQQLQQPNLLTQEQFQLSLPVSLPSSPIQQQQQIFQQAQAQQLFQQQQQSILNPLSIHTFTNPYSYMPQSPADAVTPRNTTFSNNNNNNQHISSPGYSIGTPTGDTLTSSSTNNNNNTSIQPPQQLIYSSPPPPPPQSSSTINNNSNYQPTTPSQLQFNSSGLIRPTPIKLASAAIDSNDVQSVNRPSYTPLTEMMSETFIKVESSSSCDNILEFKAVRSEPNLSSTTTNTNAASDSL